MAAWAGLGYYARARNLLACARAVVAEHGGVFPRTEAELRTLPGLGAYTAAAVAAIAFGERAVVVDANVERVVARLFAIAEPLPAARTGDPRGGRRDHARRARGRFRAGDDGSRRDDLHPARAADACSARCARDCAGFASGAPEAFPVKARQGAPSRSATARSSGLERDGRGAAGPPPATRACSAACARCRPGLDAMRRRGWTARRSRPTGGCSTRRRRHGFTHFRLELALAVGDGRRRMRPRERRMVADGRTRRRPGCRRCSPRRPTRYRKER